MKVELAANDRRETAIRVHAVVKRTSVANPQNGLVQQSPYRHYTRRLGQVPGPGSDVEGPQLKPGGHVQTMRGVGGNP